MTRIEEAVEVLKSLISIPSISREESKTADFIEDFLRKNKISPNRIGNNVWAKLSNGDNLPTILLDSHHDTVKPVNGWTFQPFTPMLVDGKLYGLGSNDAGGSLVALLFTFLHFSKETNLPYNLIFSASAEEEVSGKNGVELMLNEVGMIDFGIIGEPTQMQMAIAEKGLLVLDCTSHGKSGHAARNEGINAIYETMPDIDWFRNYKFEKISELLGEVKMTVTQINAGYQHNVVPDVCNFVVDIRTNEHYANQEIFEFISKSIKSEVKARSFRLNSSQISKEHPIVKSGQKLGLQYYGSPTLSNQALMNFPTLKIGPGDSTRSHTADEFIFINEIENAIEIYIKLLNNVLIR